jgi:hypothetical protein
MKKGGGTGPVKPWQPAVHCKVLNPILTESSGKDKLMVVFFELLPLLHSLAKQI